MNCNNAWDREFLDEKCTKKFVNNEFKSHRKSLLFQKEQCLLPQAQTWIAYHNEKKAVDEQIRVLARQQDALQMESYRVSNMLRNNNFEHGGVKRKFTRKCPYEGCRGFLSTQWKCDVCENYTCQECNEVKGSTRNTEHTCDPGNVETTKLIAKDCKPCPNCGIMISKILGCNQMWCTECNTAFDWKSLRIITGQIHNPHFFEARRALGVNVRNPLDIPCGGLPRVDDFDSWNAGLRGTGIEPKILIDLICAIDGIDEPRESNNLVERVEFLRGNMSEEQFSKIIETRDRRYQHGKEQFDIVVMLRTTCTDLLRQAAMNVIPYAEMVESVTKLVNYSNENLYKICKRYNLVTLNIMVSRRRRQWGVERYFTNYFEYLPKSKYKVEEFYSTTIAATPIK
tara:strand:- start:425 stop:1618 length:1194 start_codon:yes stop_codon:yes gene_type:complete